MAWEFGHRSVICKTDCLDAYNLVFSNSIAGVHHDLVSKIHDLRNRSWNLSFVLIDRLANGVADYLAKHAAAAG
ncbi:hypothetical protein PIB30_054301, partial [Stylosanthes scabra]|nr:hypothetical protein [Stylosanthes scabra]